MDTNPPHALAGGAEDPRSATELLPLVYNELRRLAAARLGGERLGNTLQPTALVHRTHENATSSQQRRHPGFPTRPASQTFTRTRRSRQSRQMV